MQENVSLAICIGGEDGGENTAGDNTEGWRGFFVEDLKNFCVYFRKRRQE